MAYTKRIICLAKSWRPGGSCIAGKEVLNDGSFGGWIRPINDQGEDGIGKAELRKTSGYELKLGDMVDISFDEHTPNRHQVENHRITPDSPWVDQYFKPLADIINAVDHIPGDLWHNGTNSQDGTNDEVPENLVDQYQSSLVLIQVPALDISITHTPRPDGKSKRTYRGNFQYNRTPYSFRITDPTLHWRIADRTAKTFKYENPLLCISLTGVFPETKCAHKLIAAVIANDM